MARMINHFRELNVYQAALSAAMSIFDLTKRFPVEERYAMTDQMRRSSRSVCANIAEAWRKRRYKAAFIAKLSDAESEAGETQVWIELAARCRYIGPDVQQRLDDAYDHIMAQIVRMMDEPDKWLIRSRHPLPETVP